MSIGALITEMGVDLGYTFAGLLLLNLGRWVVDRLVLTQFSTTKEIIEDRNAGTGAVEFGAYIATALVIAGAISGNVLPQGLDAEIANVAVAVADQAQPVDPGSAAEAVTAVANVESTSGPSPWLTTIVFFLLGQIVLVLFARVYQWATKYDIHAEIEKDNVAAGVALGMGMISIGIVLLKATMDDFVSWKDNLTEFAMLAAVGFVILMIMRKFTDRVLLPNTTIAHEIANDQNIGAAWIEGVVSIGMAAIIFFMI